MTHTYKITGMTCEACQAKVQKVLQSIPGISAVNINLQAGEAEISMDKHVPTSELQRALEPYPNYQLAEKKENIPHIMEEETKPWLETYKPVLLIFAFITGVTLLAQLPAFNWMLWMNDFMAGFFLVFSFFKLLNLQGFADSYATYDIIARRWRGYGFLYAFIELGLGLAYLTGFNPLITNIVAFTVMSISLIGVLQSLINKRKIRCACLGDVFNLPMSTITVMEDVLMIVMSGIMLVEILIEML